jgi:hypothetical protein
MTAIRIGHDGGEPIKLSRVIIDSPHLRHLADGLTRFVSSTHDPSVFTTRTSTHELVDLLREANRATLNPDLINTVRTLVDTWVEGLAEVGTKTGIFAPANSPITPEDNLQVIRALRTSNAIQSEQHSGMRHMLGELERHAEAGVATEWSFAYLHRLLPPVGLELHQTNWTSTLRRAVTMIDSAHANPDPLAQRLAQHLVDSVIITLGRRQAGPGRPEPIELQSVRLALMGFDPRGAERHAASSMHL